MTEDLDSTVADSSAPSTSATPEPAALADDPGATVAVDSTAQGSASAGQEPARWATHDAYGPAATQAPASGLETTQADDPGDPSEAPEGTVRRVGDYEVLSRIARGGMGVVYRARQVSLNRIVALKMVLGSGFADEGQLRRFRVEAEATAELDHPNIVPIYDVGEHDGHPYFAMKLLEGGSLAERAAGFVGDPVASASLVATVARAVHAAHQRGILHRDLKPANILVDREGRPHVTDFGLAKKLGDDSGLTQSGAVMGTPSYMPPEQAAGRIRELTVASDVYSLGAILYELLTGRPPFRGEGVLDTLRQVATREPERPRSIDGRIPRDLEVIALRCLEKDPARRYGSARALAEDLDGWSRGEPISARPVSAGERAIKWARRNPAVASLAVAVFLVAVAGTTGVVWKWRDAVASAREAEENARLADWNAREARGNAEGARQAADKARRDRDRAATTAYFASINLAQRDYESAHIGRVAEILEGQRPEPGLADLRAFEWHYLRRLIHSDLRTLEGHSDGIFGVAFSPDGRRIASAGYDGAVKVWDAAAGVEVVALRGHEEPAAAVAFSPDGRLVASASWDRTVKLWDTTTGAEVRTLRGHADGVPGVAFRPDGRRMASAGYDAVVKVWDVATGAEVLTFRGHARAVNAVAYSPDGRRIASAGFDRTVKVWDADTGATSLTLEGHASSINAVAFSPDGRRIASASHDGSAKVWDAAVGSEILTFRGHARAVNAVAFGPDGRLIASAGFDSTVKLWDAGTGAEVLTLRGHADSVAAVAFDPDGRRVASASWDRTVKLWAAGAEVEALTLAGHVDAVSGVAYSPDGRRIASASWDRTVRVWDAELGAEALVLRGHADAVTAVAYSPDGRRIASAGDDNAVRVWDAGSGGPIAAFGGHDGSVTALAFSPDGRRIASAADEGGVEVWDADTGVEIRAVAGHPDPVTALAYSPNGRRIASASWDRTVKLWDAETGAEVRTLNGHANVVSGVAFSPDGRRIASAGYDRTVRVWEVATGAEALTLKGHMNAVTAVAYSPDGRRLISASHDGTIKVWDAASGAEALTLRGHANAIAGVAFRPDGLAMASGGYDGLVKVWDASDPTGPGAVRREAVGLLRSLLGRVGSEAELVARIRGDRTVSEPVRAAARPARRRPTGWPSAAAGPRSRAHSPTVRRPRPSFAAPPCGSPRSGSRTPAG